MGRAALFLVAALAVLPLAGLCYGLVVPPPALFGAEPETLGSIATSPRVLALLLRSVALAAVVSVLALGLGTWLAWLEQRTRYPGGRWLAVASLLPLAVPSYLLAATLRNQLSAGGAIGPLPGLPAFTGLLPAILTLTVITTPLVQVVVGAALARSSAAEEEAARTLGASGWRLFATVWLPRLRPAWAMSLLLVALYVISDFGAVAVLDCPVLTWRLYQAVNLVRTQEAAVYGVALLLMTIPLLIAARALKRGAAHGQVANPRPAQRRPLGPVASVGAITVQVILVGVGVILPAATLIAWIAGGIGQGVVFASLTRPALHSLGVGLACTAAIVLIALVPAWAMRRQGRSADLVDDGVYATGALPGILLGGGLLLTALAIARLSGWTELYRWILGSGILLLIGYTARFLPEAFAPLATAARQLDMRQIEAARCLGAPPWRRLGSVVAPALAPGMAAAFVLVFVAIIKELPITLLLGGAMGLSPLSYRIWERYDGAFLPDAGVAGLVLLGIALAAVVVSLRFRRHA